MTSGPIKSIDQVGVVVRDLDAAMARYSADFGIGPWRVFTISSETCLGGMWFRGKEQPHSFKAALATVGNMSYELIQPLDGPSTYWEFLKARGEGIHHLGFLVESVQDTSTEMAARGYPVLQSAHGMGKKADGAYAYYETEATLGCLVEALEAPASGMPDPDRIFEG